MLCQNCKKNNATVFYKETINGETSSYALCSECAKKMEDEGKISFNSPLESIGDGFFSPFDEINDIFSGFFGKPQKAISAYEEKRCPMCKSSFNDIVKAGKVGCAKCYETFASELESTVKSIHGNVSHVGRTSGPWKKKKEKNDKIAKLKSELAAAIEAQEFEKAAELRDKIKETEGEN